MSSLQNFRVDSFVAGLAIKAPCRVASDANIATLSGLQTINSVVLQEGDRVLVKDQTDPVENGIYDAQISAWRRSGDFDGNRDVVGGTIVPAFRASDQEIVLWNVDGTPDPVTPDQSSILFSLYYDPTTGAASSLQDTTVVGNTTDQGIEITDGGDLIIREAAGRQIRFSMTSNPAVINLEQAGGPTVPAGINFTGAGSEYFFSTNIRVVDGITCQSNGFISALNGLGTENVQLLHDDTWGRVETTGGSSLLLSSADGGVFMPEQAAAAGSVAGFGQLWVRDDNPNTLIFTNDAGTDFELSTLAAGSGILSADKDADTDRDNTTTYATDPDLDIPNVPVGKYLVTCILKFDPGNGAMGFRWEFGGTAGFSFSFLDSIITTDSGGVVDARHIIMNGNNTYASSAARNIVRMTGVIDVTSIGSVRIRWAQNVLDAGTLTLEDNSSLTLQAI